MKRMRVHTVIRSSVTNAGGNVIGLFRCLEGPRLPRDHYPASAQVS